MIELIQNTTSDKSKKSWKEKAIALPFELRKNSSAHININDAIDDFIKTVFLPYCIQKKSKDFQGENAQQLFKIIHPQMVTRLLKGVPIGAISKLSSHWHEPGRAAQLNKAKSFSSESWEPLFTSPLSYECEGNTVTVTPLINSQELSKEGKDLGHCVGGYTNKCLQENSHIVSIRDEKGKSLSTIELKLLRGKGEDNDSKTINIDRENQYHLVLIQHFGNYNSPPPSISKKAEEQLFLDLRIETVKVNLPLLESKRKERVRILEEKGDIILIGYDPLDKKCLDKAIEIYRTHGIGNIPYGKTLRSNFDALTGKGKQVQIVKLKKSNNDSTIDISNIQSFFDTLLQKDAIKVSADCSKNRHFGEVLITLSDKNNISIEGLKQQLKGLSPKFENITVVGDKIVKIVGLTPKNVAGIIKAALKSK